MLHYTQIGQHLLRMCAAELINSFDFDNKSIFDQYVQTEGNVERMLPYQQRNRNLSRYLEAARL